MVIKTISELAGDLADGVARAAERAEASAAQLFEPSVRLGVTGLSRAGKTVFITSLVANLLERGRMAGLAAEAEGRILAAALTEQPDIDAPRFDYEQHRDALFAAEPLWPESTRTTTRLRLSLRYRPTGILSGIAGDGRLHVDIVDYPGEWLLDLALLGLDYETWSESALERAEIWAVHGVEAAADFLKWSRGRDSLGPLDEPAAQAGAALFAEALRAAKAAGFSRLSPGRFLLPGDLAGAPALTFAPLPKPADAVAKPPDGALRAAFARRFEGYKRTIARPFFETHFRALDRQIVLIDALGAAAAGPEQAADLGRAMTEILSAFRPGAASWLGRLLGARRIDRLLLAVSKADHVHHSFHPALEALTRDLVNRSVDAARYKGADVATLSVAGVRATVEATLEGHPAVRGRLAEKSGAAARVFAGKPPETLAEMTDPSWERDALQAARFAPPKLERRPGEGPPHIRLDRAVDILLGDYLR